MANPQQLTMLKKQGVRVWNKWRHKSREEAPDQRVCGTGLQF
jgi:hypothetical protein